MSVTMLEDRMPVVRFGKIAQEDRNATIEAGRLITKDVDMVYVKQIGERDETECNAKEWLEKQRVKTYGVNGQEPTLPEAWFARYEKCYENYLKGFQNQPDGFPVREWAILTPSQVSNMHSMETFTVEQVAGWTDTAMARFGMHGRELKNKAQSWLQSGDQKATQISALQVANETLKSQLEKLTTDMQALQAEAAEDKPRRGRPPNQDKE